MLYHRTFPNELAAREAAQLEAFENYEIVSRPEPIHDFGPMGSSTLIPNIRYFIVYTP
ncbi:hypothetical protein NF681_11380 [Comamonadaceae bacterium OTU4NAUVB1]|nr:hypothetical protein NF681_11380 [Comamonadaceae bacterium OTU4NAUVB1]